MTTETFDADIHPDIQPSIQSNIFEILDDMPNWSSSRIVDRRSTSFSDDSILQEEMDEVNTISCPKTKIPHTANSLDDDGHNIDDDYSPPCIIKCFDEKIDHCIRNDYTGKSSPSTSLLDNLHDTVASTDGEGDGNNDEIEGLPVSGCGFPKESKQHPRPHERNHYNTAVREKVGGINENMKEQTVLEFCFPKKHQCQAQTEGWQHSTLAATGGGKRKRGDEYDQTIKQAPISRPYSRLLLPRLTLFPNYSHGYCTTSSYHTNVSTVSPQYRREYPEARKSWNSIRNSPLCPNTHSQQQHKGHHKPPIKNLMVMHYPSNIMQVQYPQKYQHHHLHRYYQNHQNSQDNQYHQYRHQFGSFAPCSSLHHNDNHLRPYSAIVEKDGFALPEPPHQHHQSNSESISYTPFPTSHNFHSNSFASPVRQGCFHNKAKRAASVDRNVPPPIPQLRQTNYQNQDEGRKFTPQDCLPTFPKHPSHSDKDHPTSTTIAVISPGTSSSSSIASCGGRIPLPSSPPKSNQASTFVRDLNFFPP